MKKTRLLLPGIAAVLALSACHASASVSVGDTPKVSRSALEKQISTALAGQAGTTPDAVTCPAAGLKGKVGSTQRCTVAANGVSFAVTTTVTSVKGTHVRFHVAQSSAPTVERAGLEKEISSELAAQVGQTPDAVTCPDDGLVGKVGQTQRCQLTAGGTSLGVTATVTSVEGTDVKFDIQVDNTPTAGS